MRTPKVTNLNHRARRRQKVTLNIPARRKTKSTSSGRSRRQSLTSLSRAAIRGFRMPSIRPTLTSCDHPFAVSWDTSIRVRPRSWIIYGDRTCRIARRAVLRNRSELRIYPETTSKLVLRYKLF